MNNYNEEFQRIKEKLKRANERGKALDDRTEKQMIVYEDMSLYEIVSRLNNPDVEIDRVRVIETAERDMQEFGSKSLDLSQIEEMKEYFKSDDYMFQIFLKYRQDLVELDINNKIFTLRSSNPDIVFSDIYDDTKKNELDDMLNNDFDNKEMVDNSNYKLK